MFAATVLLETDVLTEMAIPNFTLVKKEPRFYAIVETPLERRPDPVILLHDRIVSRRVNFVGPNLLK